MESLKLFWWWLAAAAARIASAADLSSTNAAKWAATRVSEAETLAMAAA
jgi:hypothetical protein